MAFVRLEAGAEVPPEQLIAHVRSRLAHFKAPKQIVFADLPKTATGKIRKSELRRRAAEGA